jgi:DNA (cytosine-5)-methyltransferase 1
VPYDLFQITAPLNRQSRDERSPCHTQARDNAAHAAVVQPFAFDAGQTDVCVYGDKTGPLDTDPGTIGVQLGMSVRRLTPTECERLQGFPDGWTAIPWKGKPASECPDGPRYRALGNSMAVNVMRWIGRRIEMVDAL